MVIIAKVGNTRTGSERTVSHGIQRERICTYPNVIWLSGLVGVLWVRQAANKGAGPRLHSAVVNRLRASLSQIAIWHRFPSPIANDPWSTEPPHLRPCLNRPAMLLEVTWSDASDDTGGKFSTPYEHMSRVPTS